ncbi:MAG: hypothetical protein KA327_10100 [Pseudarcicella sp.]|nr:hypothetical protein [Pseudarcicella sp.]
MQKILILLTNNQISDPFLHSQLLDIYKEDNKVFQEKHLFCGFSNNEINSQSSFKLHKNALNEGIVGLLKLLFRFVSFVNALDRKQQKVIHIRGFVSGILYWLSSFFLNGKGKINYIYDPRGAFLNEMVEKKYWLKPIVFLMEMIEKKMIEKSIMTIVTTQKFKDLFVEKYGFADKINVLYNSSSFEDDNSLDRISSLENDIINLCYCGTVNHWHNLDEIIRLLVYTKSVLKGKRVITYIFTQKKYHQEVKDKLQSINFEDFKVEFVPYNELQARLLKMDICLSVVMPTLSTSIASPIKISDYIKLNKLMILNKGIGDFDEFYLENNSAILYEYGEEMVFSANDLKKVNPRKNQGLAIRIDVKTNRKQVFDSICNIV